MTGTEKDQVCERIYWRGEGRFFEIKECIVDTLPLNPVEKGHLLRAIRQSLGDFADVALEYAGVRGTEYMKWLEQNDPRR